MVLLIGTLLGGISGVIVAKGKVQAFIATLVTMTLLRGITMVYTDGRPITTGFRIMLIYLLALVQAMF